MVLLFFSCCVVISAPVEGYILDNGNTLIAYNSSFCFFIDASNLTTSLTMPIYRGVLNDGDTLFAQNGSVLNPKNFVTSEQDAPLIVQNEFEQFGGLPPDAELAYSHTSYLEKIRGSTGEVVEKRPTHTSVIYHRRIDGMPIVGQIDKINVALGENGTVLSVYKVWRTIEFSGQNTSIISLDKAIHKFLKGELLDPPISVPNFTIQRISNGFYEKSRTDPSIVLEPAWIFFGNTSSGNPIKFYVYARQFANFTASSTLISQGDTVQFTDTSDAGPVKWYWDFGDGENSTLQNPAHTYRKHGNFSVMLTAWNDLGSDTITREDYIQMYSTAAPVAKFTSNFTYDHYYPPLAVAFTDASTGMNLSWYWDFDDGSNATEQDPVHTYSTIPDDQFYTYYIVNLTVKDEMGRLSSSSAYVEMQRNMTPDFTAEPRLASGNRTIVFTDLTPRGNWTYGYYNHSYYQSWSFGDGEGTEWYPGSHEDYEAPPVSVTHEYVQPGNYTVSLTTDVFAGGEGGVTTTKEDYIAIVNNATPLVTDFTANTTSGTTPLAVAFTDETTGLPAGWNWSFGDGTQSDDKDPVHVYAAPGIYTVSLTATNIFGSNTTTRPDYITVTALQPPVAGFSANITSGYSPLPVSFTDESLYLPAVWAWDFGDGTNSADQNPQHIYIAPGNYSVNLTVMNDRGSNSSIKSDYIHVLSELPQVIPDPEGFPFANFTANETLGKAPLAIEFIDRTRNATTFWNWSFGDGGISVEQDPVHSYTLPGTYTVSLAAGNVFGENSSVKTDYITVLPGILPLVASFTGTPVSGKAPLKVTFTDSSAGTPTAWSWDFGDNTNSTLQDPVHTYTAAGKYTVSLTVSNAGGSNTSTRLDYITVSGSGKPPVAKFSAKPTSGYVPLSVTFTDSSTNNPTSWLWDFGDNTNSMEQNPVHEYTTPGKYTVSLTATNTGGSSTKTRENYITVKEIPAPAANFKADPRTGYPALAVSFTDTSTKSPTGWYWSFGDGTNSTEQNPVHEYTAPGKYTVSLTATNAGGSSTKTRENYITVNGISPPKANFKAAPASGYSPLTVMFTDTSTSSPTSWSWDFGDGGNSSDQNPVHEYAAAGKYTVSLTAANDGGSTTKTRTNYITVKAVTPTPTPVPPRPVPVVNATADGCSVRIDWDVITDSRLQGYKVVISKNNPNPVYPADGYMFWITEWYRNYSVIASTDHYNSGDFGGYLQPGQTYYFSITAVYSDAKVAGNAVEIEFPSCGTTTPTCTTIPVTTCTPDPCEPHAEPLLNGTPEDGKIRLDWDAITNPCLQGYKVVISKNNPEPTYPDDGYMFWITDRYHNYSMISTTDHYSGGDFGEYLQPGEEYYFSITAVYSDAKIAGNVLRLVYPPDATPAPTLTPGTIPADVRIEPETLNLNSSGEFTAFIMLPPGYDVNDISTASLICEGAHATDGHATGEGSDMFIAKFDRQDLAGVPAGENVEFTVTGTVISNGIETPFSGNDTIRVMD